MTFLRWILSAPAGFLAVYLISIMSGAFMDPRGGASYSVPVFAVMLISCTFGAYAYVVVGKVVAPVDNKKTAHLLFTCAAIASFCILLQSIKTGFYFDAFCSLLFAAVAWFGCYKDTKNKIYLN